MPSADESCYFLHMDINVFGGIVSGITFLIMAVFAVFVWAPLPFLTRMEEEEKSEVLVAEAMNRLSEGMDGDILKN